MRNTNAGLCPARYLAALAQRPSTAPRHAPRTGLQALLARVDHPQREVRCIHVAGSKGKGTTALMLEAMLQAGGRRTGVFTSPHLEHWNERIRLHGAPVDDALFAEVLAELQPHVTELHARGFNGPVFFEVLLVAALCLFRQAGIDEAIIEAGIGARHDATRVVTPVVTALVSVELEHTELLGPDLATIARDKGAIARPGVPLVIGPLAPVAQTTVAELAQIAEAPLIQPQFQLLRERLRVRVDKQVELPLAAPNLAQASCMAVAFGCLRALELFAAPERIAADGVVDLQLPGRQEVLAREPFVIADGAHTQASFAALAQSLAVWVPEPAPLSLVLSCSGKRDLSTLAAPLLARAQTLFITRADATRSADPMTLAAAVHGRCPCIPVRVVESPCAAMAQAREQARAGGAVCATGSVYMAGVARRCVRDGTMRAS